MNPISVHQLQFNSPHASEMAKIGLIVAVVALTVHSSSLFIPFHLFFNIIHEHFEFLVKSVMIHVPTSGSHCVWSIFFIHKRMLAMGFMNIAGSLTSCYAATDKKYNMVSCSSYCRKFRCLNTYIGHPRPCNRSKWICYSFSCNCYRNCCR